MIGNNEDQKFKKNAKKFLRCMCNTLLPYGYESPCVSYGFNFAKRKRNLKKFNEEK